MPATKKSSAETKSKDQNKEELQRLKKQLTNISEKLEQKKPDEKEFSPLVYNDLKPYSNTQSVEYTFREPSQTSEGYMSRFTAIGLCDPWVAHKKDSEFNEKTVTPRHSSKSKEERKKSKDDRPKEGSTHLPKYYINDFDNAELAHKELYFTDIPMLREELHKNLSTDAEKKIESDYIRTKQDYYRMELHKLEEVHPMNRDNMTKAYYAYLQNTPGSKKALLECIKETRKKLKEMEDKGEEKEGEAKKEEKDDEDKDNDNEEQPLEKQEEEQEEQQEEQKEENVEEDEKPDAEQEQETDNPEEETQEAEN